MQVRDPPEQTSQSISEAPWLRLAVVVAVGCFLLWEVVTRSFVAYFANAAPETALAIRASEPRALLTIVERHLRPVERPKDDPQAVRPAGKGADGMPPTVKQEGDRLRLWAEQALKSLDKPNDQLGAAAPSAGGPLSEQASRLITQLRASTELALSNDPLNARALSILGQLAHMAGDEARAATFLNAAAQRSIRESVAIYWLMRKSHEAKDFASAVYCADALLRTRSQAGQYVMPMLVELAENSDATGALKKTLLKNPPWRSSFLSALAQRASDPRATLELVLAIKEAGAPLSADEFRSFVNALIARKEYELAYYAWLQFLPVEQLTSTGFLFNGSFEVTPSGLPFDWIMHGGSGVSIDIVQRSDLGGQRALSIEFGHGRVEFPGVQQLTMLAPGTYEFRGKYKGEVLGKRGLVWRVACVDRPDSPIGESVMAIGVFPRWRDMEFSFTVPDSDCRAQIVRLTHDARMPSEQLVSGAMLYDDLGITRAEKSSRP